MSHEVKAFICARGHQRGAFVQRNGEGPKSCVECGEPIERIEDYLARVEAQAEAGDHVANAVKHLEHAFAMTRPASAGTEGPGLREKLDLWMSAGKPWEKYPVDVTADLEIKGPGEDVKLTGITPAKAHAELLRAYLAAQGKVTGDTEPDFFIECLDRAARGGGFSGMSGHGYSVTLMYRRPRINTAETVRCPRRDEGGPGSYFPEPDKWEKIGDWRCCSYCGSMHPDDVIEAVKEYGRSIVESTDKGYKRYIRLPNTPNASFGPIKFYVMHFNKAQIEAINSLLFPRSNP